MKKILLTLISFVFLSTLDAQKTYIWCGTLIDGISNEPKKNMTIVVEKNKIVAVQNGFVAPDASDPSSSLRTIDLKTKTINAGWIDMHVNGEN